MQRVRGSICAALCCGTTGKGRWLAARALATEPAAQWGGERCGPMPDGEGRRGLPVCRAMPLPPVFLRGERGEHVHDRLHSQRRQVFPFCRAAASGAVFCFAVVGVSLLPHSPCPRGSAAYTPPPLQCLKLYLPAPPVVACVRDGRGCFPCINHPRPAPDLSQLLLPRPAAPPTCQPAPEHHPQPPEKRLGPAASDHVRGGVLMLPATGASYTALAWG